MKCPLCGSAMVYFIRKNGYDIYRCDACGLGKTRLEEFYDSFVRKHYDRGYFTGDTSRVAYVDYQGDKPYIMRNMKIFMSHLSRYKKKGKLLDVGCAMGFSIEVAIAFGYDAYGIDPSKYAVKQARRLLGNRVKQATISSADYPKESFDIITLFDVFEHLANPKRDLAKLYTLLKPGGIILIATGDTGSILARILKRRWTFYIPPQHLFFYNRSNLDSMLKLQKLKPLTWFRIGKWLSLRYVLHLAKTTGESKFAWILDSMMSKFGIGGLPMYLPVQDNMVVIAQKKPHTFFNARTRNTTELSGRFTS